MKLKNRKTGEIVELKLIQVNDKYLEDHEVDLLNGEKLTLKSLADSFDDVKEPLIKDKKIRKAVRAWAEENEIITVEYDDYWVPFRRDDKTISFKDEDRCLGFYGLENSRDYTIDELCGEEK